MKNIELNTEKKSEEKIQKKEWFAPKLEKIDVLNVTQSGTINVTFEAGSYNPS